MPWYFFVVLAIGGGSALFLGFIAFTETWYAFRKPTATARILDEGTVRVTMRPKSGCVEHVVYARRRGDHA